MSDELREDIEAELELLDESLGSVTPLLDEADRLKSYLDFRHFFRHSYGFRLRWERMSPLVLALRDTADAVARELRAFLDRPDRGHG